MGEIYCLYSSEDGVPRYVGAAEGSADKSWKKHITDALDLVSGSLYDWMRDIARRGHYVGLHVLQSGIIPTEVDFYERYWVSQFPGLFNTHADSKPLSDPTDVAINVISVIKSKLATQHSENEKP
jgi:hypothetical protein